MKMLLLGHARHGKDEVANLLKPIFTSGGTLEIAKELVYPILKDKYGYRNIEKCIADRVNHRKEWFDIIADYNKDNKSAVAELVFSKVDIYIGQRALDEFIVTKQKRLFDICVFVDASSRVPMEKTMQIPATLADYILDNNGTLDDLKKNTILLLSQIIKEHR